MQMLKQTTQCNQRINVEIHKRAKIYCVSMSMPFWRLLELALTAYLDAAEASSKATKKGRGKA